MTIVTTSIAYPIALPGPQVATIQSAERRALTAAAGARDARAIQRDRLATQQLQFTLTAAEALAFKAWIDDDLTFGGAWFASDWPLPQGMVTGVRRLLMDTERWQFLGVGHWRVTISCEVRGRGELPLTFEFTDFFDPLGKSANITLSNANRTASGDGALTNKAARTLLPKSSGSLYVEFVINVGLHSAQYPTIGLARVSFPVDMQPGDSSNSWGFFHGFKYFNTVATAYGDAWGTGDVVGLAWDSAAGKLWISVNGTFEGDPTAGTDPAFTGVTGTLLAAASLFGTTPSVVTIALYDQHFTYAPPAGFTAWE